MNYGNYIEDKNIKNILVIKFRHLGDVLLATPVFYNLKKKFKEAKIDAFIYGDSLEVLRNNPYIDEILVYERKNKEKFFFKRLKREFQILRDIKKRKYDLVINLTEGDRGAIIAFFSKAKYKVGVHPENKGFFKKEKIFTHLVKTPKTKRHAVEKNLDALRRIGIFPNNDEKNLFFKIPTEANNNILKILKENNLNEKDYILIHPTTRWKFKCWDKFNELIDFLIKKQRKVIVVSGKDLTEIEIANKLVENLNVINLAGKVNVDELAALISFSKLFFCLDSFSFHLANTLKAKTIAFFGPTCDITWGIWENENARVLKSNLLCRPCNVDGCGGSKVSECLKDIKLDDTFAYIDQLL